MRQLVNQLWIVALIPLLLLAQNPAVTVAVDANANRHPINPNVYGIAYGTSATLADLNAPLNRYGGNNTSRYNWQLNADNRGQDWYFESIAEPIATPGERGDTFISTSKGAGAQALITIPMVGYVGNLGSGRSKLASFSIAKYGNQTGNDWQWFPDAGNGILSSNGAYVTGNNPADANVPANSSFQAAWVQHIVNTFGLAANGGLRYYILDNEPSIWHSTHRDVHPTGANMDEIKSKMIDYANQIKLIDPGALVVGPEEWGWSGYFYSGYDQQWGSLHGWSNLPDRANHGGSDYLPWLLNQLKQTTVAGGLRPLDIFTVHYYPQGGEFGNDTSTTMQLLRNKSTRSLWDPNYIDQTWINDKVQLIPRLRNWVNTYYYSGTPIGITEYNWGAEGHINGATTQADIYGIFGRENLDIGARWTTPDPSTPTYKAMKMYRNYDGNKSTFGDTSVAANVPNPDNLAAFAAQRTSDNALTVMVISKVLSGSTPVTLSLANFSGNGTAQAWQLTSSNTITRLADLNYTGGSLAATVPPQSVTLFVLPSGTGNILPTAALTATPSSGVAPLGVTLNASGSHDSDGTITNYAWVFGDGGTSSGAASSIAHTYTTAGTYTAKVTVTDNSGGTASATAAVTVTSGNILPTAALTATPSSGVAPLAVTLNASGSHDSDGTITSYAWTFGDGGTSSGAASSVTHTYTTPGTYTAKVTVTDNSGGTASATATVTATTDPNLIAAPANLSARGNKRSASLTWTDKSSNETGFHIERAPDGGTFAVVGSVGANVTSFTDVVASGTYSYRVQAFNQTTGRVSAYSNTVSVRVR